MSSKIEGVENLHLFLCNFHKKVNKCIIGKNCIFVSGQGKYNLLKMQKSNTNSKNARKNNTKLVNIIYFLE